MLKNLLIQNYAIIENLKIDFSSGFSVITGETGSGKSILLGAISMLLGQRFDSKILLDKQRKCIIEGEFTSNSSVNRLLTIKDIDCGEEIILRREISINGKSRAFINDTPVKLNFIKEIGSQVIEIHNQNQSYVLKEKSFLYSFLDSAIKIENVYDKYKATYNEFKLKERELHNLVLIEKQTLEKKDYLEFQFAELSKYPIDSWNEDEINKQHNYSLNLEDIKEQFLELDKLTNSENSPINLLNQLSSIVEKLSYTLPSLKKQEERLNSIKIDLIDIIDEISSEQSNRDFNSNNLQELNEQIHIIKSLTKKFNLLSLNDIIKKKDEIDNLLSNFSSVNINKKRINQELKVLDTKCCEIGKILTNNRLKGINNIQTKLNSLFSKLSMPNAEIKFVLNNTNTITIFGTDMLEVLISTNKGGEFLPIHKIASGGEMSRILLSIKSLLTIDNTIPSIIFDEIDSGVSGKIASEVGDVIRNISQKSQVICITHLPQVACFADKHYKVIKEDINNITKTSIIKLDDNQKLNELANMLGGTTVGKAAFENALELLEASKS